MFWKRVVNLGWIVGTWKHLILILVFPRFRQAAKAPYCKSTDKSMVSDVAKPLISDALGGHY